MKKTLTLLILTLSTYNLFSQIRFEEFENQNLPGVSSSSVNFSDINNDNFTDFILTGNRGLNGPISIIKINDGKGNFSTSTLQLEGTEESSVLFSDLDGDSHKDLILTGNTNNDNIFKIYKNDGLGNFELKADVWGGLKRSSIATADIDGDGDQDIIATGYAGDETTYLLINDGEFSFTYKDHNIQDIAESSVGFSDIDNDGDQDLLITGRIGSTSATAGFTELYKNDGDGNFIPVPNTPFTAFNDASIAFLDVDDDNDSDIIISGYELGSSSFVSATRLYINDGSGNYTEAFNRGLVNANNSSIDYGDIDGDGDIDVIISGSPEPENFLGSYVNLYENDGNGNFTSIENLLIRELRSGDLELADVDGDSDLDLLITGFQKGTGQRFSLLYQNVTGEIAGDINKNSLIEEGEVAGDVDENGIIDKNEIAGDINGNGEIGVDETAGDINGNRVIDSNEVLGDVNGDNLINADEFGGDLDGNKILDFDEVLGDLNNNGSVDDEMLIPGDVNGSGTIDNNEIAGDLNLNGQIDDLEDTGDTDGSGYINDDEISGDINGDGQITDTEIAGDVNGNRIIDGNEIAGDVNGNGFMDENELTGDVNGNKVVDPEEISGDISGNGIIDNNEISGDVNGDNIINLNEITGDVNGNNVIDSDEFSGDINGNGIQDYVNSNNSSIKEIIGDSNGNLIIDENEVDGDVNNDGIVNENDPEILTSVNKNLGNFYSLYPNPSTGKLFIETLEKNNNTQVSIFDLTGQLIFEKNTMIPVQLDLSHLNKGIFIIRLESELGTINEKITIE